MFKLGSIFGRAKAAAPAEAEAKRPDWPLWFDDYSFGVRCYNTLKSSVIFAGHQLSLDADLVGPSGQPHARDWKDTWDAFFGSGGELNRYGFPSPVEIRWTALDCVEREMVLDLDMVFPGRLILHSVPREEIVEGWESSPHLRHVEILLEVNDRVINVYMRACVLARGGASPDSVENVLHFDPILAWSQTYKLGASDGS